MLIFRAYNRAYIGDSQLEPKIEDKASNNRVEAYHVLTKL